VLFAELLCGAARLDERVDGAEHAGAQPERFGGMHGVSAGNDRIGGIGVGRTVKIESQRGIVHHNVLPFFHVSGIGVDDRFDEVAEHIAVLFSVEQPHKKQA